MEKRIYSDYPNADLEGKYVVIDGTEYVITEPLGTGEYYWQIRNVDDDITKEMTVEILRKAVKTYKEDVANLGIDKETIMKQKIINALQKRADEAKNHGMPQFVMGLNDAIDTVKKVFEEMSKENDGSIYFFK